MNLYVARHAEAFTKEEDPARNLNEIGKNQADKIGQFLQNTQQPVKNVFHTSILRAKQTAEIIAGHLRNVKVDILSALEPEEDIKLLFQTVDYFQEDTMLVGHIPQVELLANYLLTGALNHPVAAFETAAIMCFKKENSGWVLRWFLNPQLIK